MTLVYVGDGIGDTLFGLSFVGVLRDADPSGEWGLLSKKRWWLAFMAADAPFDVNVRVHEREIGTRDDVRRSMSGRRAIRCTPDALLPGEHVTEAYLRVLRDRVPGSAPARVDVSGFPRWYGPPIDRRIVRDVGVYPCHEPAANLWSGAGPLALSLALDGLSAEVMPAPSNPFAQTLSAAEWIAGCRIFVGPDTGITHLAAAVGVPTVVVLGAKFERATFAARDATYVVVDECPIGRPAPCLRWKWPQACVCGVDRRRAAPYPCLRAVSVEAVRDEVFRRLAWKSEEETWCTGTRASR